ncbi:class I SAM-dependent methyltransferase [Polynucleobacter sp. AP-Feld-500C-C5]|uniref:class I SAM-dependent methyltransferase n=1 Tax=Polynucleobacter sp. AP-Feld-500C-C5 TaxID=2576924 RepID=UPI001C0D45E1|nr:class I SAM-dependent methyltransferase [Polynucleobacter sp. AP-Feld-500C-C5]MBU3632870.1 class I SAM-dependent methyltransferase [Polynucleobacter sp. AP-Feld-500C-C5]
MAKLNLLNSIPKSSRNIEARLTAKTDEHIRISRQYGELYFDGPREYGYGGYYYDGRWKSVAQNLVAHFGLRPGDKLLDVGCAKGFLVKDLLSLGIDAYGLDVSNYAINNCEKEVIGRLHLGSAEALPFPSNSFNAVISINTLHNLPYELCLKAVSELQRLAPGKTFIQVDSYYTPEQKINFEKWVLTAKYHDYPDGWELLFAKAGYTGDWFWTIIE